MDWIILFSLLVAGGILTSDTSLAKSAYLCVWHKYLLAKNILNIHTSEREKLQYDIYKLKTVIDKLDQIVEDEEDIQALKKEYKILVDKYLELEIEDKLK